MDLRQVEFERNVMQESDYEEPHPAKTLVINVMNGSEV